MDIWQNSVWCVSGDLTHPILVLTALLHAKPERRSELVDQLQSFAIKARLVAELIPSNDSSRMATMRFCSESDFGKVNFKFF
jgi:hypothetical protein